MMLSKNLSPIQHVDFWYLSIYIYNSNSGFFSCRLIPENFLSFSPPDPIIQLGEPWTVSIAIVAVDASKKGNKIYV